MRNHRRHFGPTDYCYLADGVHFNDTENKRFLAAIQTPVNKYLKCCIVIARRFMISY